MLSPLTCRAPSSSALPALRPNRTAVAVSPRLFTTASIFSSSSCYSVSLSSPAWRRCPFLLQRRRLCRSGGCCSISSSVLPAQRLNRVAASSAPLADRPIERCLLRSVGMALVRYAGTGLTVFFNCKKARSSSVRENAKLPSVITILPSNRGTPVVFDSVPRIINDGVPGNTSH